MKYRVLIEQDEDGIFIAECPSLPGCISQGKTRKEALDNIQDAIKGYLESLKKQCSVVLVIGLDEHTMHLGPIISPCLMVEPHISQ